MKLEALVPLQKKTIMCSCVYAWSLMHNQWKVSAQSGAHGQNVDLLFGLISSLLYDLTKTIALLAEALLAEGLQEKFPSTLQSINFKQRKIYC